MGFCGLFWMAFFWVCGGPYGNEGMNQLAPSGLVLIVYGASLFVYALPMSLINAELATAIPEDGGVVVWVQQVTRVAVHRAPACTARARRLQAARSQLTHSFAGRPLQAFGSTIGGHNAWWVLCSYLFDSAIYPILAAEYLVSAAGLDDGGGRARLAVIGFSWVVIWLVTALKLGGSLLVVRLAAVFSVVSLAPVVLYIGAGTCYAWPIDPSRWCEPPTRWPAVCCLLPARSVQTQSAIISGWQGPDGLAG